MLAGWLQHLRWWAFSKLMCLPDYKSSSLPLSYTNPYTWPKKGHDIILFSTGRLIMEWWKCSVSLGWDSSNEYFQDITQNMVCNLAKISHPADLENCYFNLELTIELYWWHVKCLLRNMLLKIASQDTYRIIMEFPSIFNAKLRLIWAECYICNCWVLWIQTWWDNSLHNTDWFRAIIIFHGPNSLSHSQNMNIERRQNHREFLCLVI